mmetsp:Transcript_16906/g.36941  ORF Transcript_16906/g.36941 Transcript_16906/m.36941 type:complete len:229 (-) Transcript_16906:114-800(-)
MLTRKTRFLWRNSNNCWRKTRRTATTTTTTTITARSIRIHTGGRPRLRSARKLHHHKPIIHTAPPATTTTTATAITTVVIIRTTTTAAAIVIATAMETAALATRRLGWTTETKPTHSRRLVKSHKPNKTIHIVIHFIVATGITTATTTIILITIVRIRIRIRIRTLPADRSSSSDNNNNNNKHRKTRTTTIHTDTTFRETKGITTTATTNVTKAMLPVWVAVHIYPNR